MDIDSLLNDVVVKKGEGPPQWKAPLQASLIHKAEKEFSDYVFPKSEEEPEAKPEAKPEPKPEKKPEPKPKKVYNLGPDIPAQPIASRGPKKAAETKIQAFADALEEGQEADPATKALFVRAKVAEDADTIERKSTYYVPSNRKMFKTFINLAYAPYKLLPISDIPDPDACAKSAAESKSSLKKFQYQKFVRDFIQYASPYRGILVYHGLGSGKTCASIAAMEALYHKGQQPVYVFTPASLEENYRGDINKCGPFLFRTNNHWTWLPLPNLKQKTPEAELAIKLLNIPISILRKQKGVWIPDPTKATGKDFEELSPQDKKGVRDQIREHMNARIQFKHYNGLSIKTLKAWACTQPTMFDGATVVIDEVHNLGRLINNSNLESFYETEPADLAQYVPKYCEKGKKYRIAYLLYRMLCSAVGCKIVALSATPIINFPQELGILANLLAGDTRMVEFNVPGASDKNTAMITTLLNAQPQVDYVQVIKQKGESIVRVTPVPSGCTKIMDPATNEFRGFLRHDIEGAKPAEIARERDLPTWFEGIKQALESNGIKPTKPTFRSLQRLPDTPDQFRDTFINQVDLKVKDETKTILLDRLSGLISYYKGGKADLMATVTKDEVVYVEMSDKQLEQYTETRNAEIKRERKAKQKQPEVKPGVHYNDVVKNQVTTFKIFSRAACNFAFPEGMERPHPADYREAAAKLIGEKGGKIGAKGEEEEEEEEEADADHVGSDESDEEAPLEKAPEKVEPPTTYDLAIAEILAKFKSPESKPLFSKDNLKLMSPKFQAILTRVEESPGPVLMYSNFRKLEGTGLLSISLEAQANFKKMDIVKTADGWRLSPETLASPGKQNRYVMYTGAEDKDKRSALLKIFNGNWSKLPAALVEQIQTLSGSKTNLHGEIVKAIIITVTGAEGISLSNVRQVHIVEPYWNYVRLEQVKGRAVRICSHMDLPPEERKVEIFTYIAKFGKDQKIDETLKNMDNSLTTDEQIMNLLVAKKQLADSLMDAMKSSAVDCELNETENGGIACYKQLGRPTMDVLYNPDIISHISDAAGVVRAAK